MIERQAMGVAIVGALSALLLGIIVAADLIGGILYQSELTYWAVRRVATLAYVLAISLLAYAGWQVAKGRGFGDVMPRLLSAAGLLLAAGATFETFGVAFVMRAFGVGDFRGIAHFDPTYVTLGAVGLLLWLLGRLMRQAIAMARELEEFL
ncbi:hypothetical protein [Aurantiacibacter sp. D1-12]|uniref:hypothetical protein n=1 Tax=Aurantiacibacter sp. D1-12 TaxID=2993658 RepID=UPI00237CF67E|nr:hypothetical protein [Aurantiacibacter sp. D1-12]MDE1467025.1 hypothetical protein [Aurantiacibacter sp. D1-12]